MFPCALMWCGQWRVFAHKYPTTSIPCHKSQDWILRRATRRRAFHPVRPARLLADTSRNVFGEVVCPRRQHLKQRAVLTAKILYRDSTFVSDLRVNPLMLSLMCGIYATEKYIPRNRPEVYDKCAEMLFERWDRQRGIEGGLPFDAHVKAAMRALALHMYNASSTSTTMTRQNLVEFVKSYLHGRRFASEEDAENAAVQFVTSARVEPGC